MNGKILIVTGVIVLALLVYWNVSDGEPETIEPVPTEGEAQAAVEAVAGDSLCELYPAFCVPLVGEGKDVFAQSELPGTRDIPTLAIDSRVVRGISADGSYFIGNPDAPIRFKVFHNFACSHCRNFHNGDLHTVIASHVATGQALLEVNLMAFGSPPYPTEAAYAAMCAGEQGAYWEMESILYERPSYATLDAMVVMAEDLGLQGGALRECVESERYAAALDIYNVLAYDFGVDATPTVLVSYGDGEWKAVNRSYDNLVVLTEAANGQ